MTLRLRARVARTKLRQPLGIASPQGKVVDALTRATGGFRESFFRQQAAEKIIARIGNDHHSQYLLSFSAPASVPAGFRGIRVLIEGRPDLRIRCRPGYWIG